MRTGITHLAIPGPTNIPEAVRQAMNVPMQDQRAPDFPELTLPLFPTSGASSAPAPAP